MKYYLIYWEGEGGDSESYSVFYSKLIQADSEIEAWEIWKIDFQTTKLAMKIIMELKKWIYGKSK